jgi:rifampicin phosphotransferase
MIKHKKHIYQLTDNEVWQVNIIGSKAKNLSTLHVKGMAVPNCFIISTAVFDEYIKHKVISKQISTHILKAFDVLSSNKVAVRSSASVEDGMGATWAGQFVTSLCVSRDELLDAIKKTFDSVSSESVTSYRIWSNTEENMITMAIIVQEMVESKYAGVLFTANPVQGEPEHMILEYVDGLGDSLVDGMVTPNTVLFDKNRNIILDHHVENDSTSEFITNTMVNMFCTVGKQIETLFNCPQDIEWSYDGNKLWILQSRPITTV